jgi:23S rRNA pseudouridine1911/1915/1917 synthase
MNKNFIVDEQYEQKRLDQFLSDMLDEARNQIIQLIKKGFVKVNGKQTCKNGLKLKIGQNIEVELPKVKKQPELCDIDFENNEKFNIDIIYEDEHILVINKPINLIVHDAPSVNEPTLVDWLKNKGIALSTISAEVRHGIVHRLDKGTSGAMVIAKTNDAHVKLSEQLQDKSMGRYYMAIIDMPLKDHTIIDKPLGRSVNNRIKMAVNPEGKEAKTAFSKLLQSDDEKYEIVLAKLFTGRTHQIRAHLNFINRHIIGDTLYDFKEKMDNIKRIYLHAFNLYLIHPVSREKMIFNAKIPTNFMEFVNKNFTKGEDIENINQDNIDNIFASFI